MNDTETVSGSGPQDPRDDIQMVLQFAKNEIIDLRIENQKMYLRLEMFDNCMALLNARGPSVGYGHKEDAVALIDRHLKAKP